LKLLRPPSQQDWEEALKHKGLVKKAAGHCVQVSGDVLSFEELVSEGWEGLLNAIQRYDPSKGNQFSTFAYPLVYRSMYDAVRTELSHQRRVRSSRPTDENEVLDPALNERTDVQRAILLLSSNLREVVLLHFYGTADTQGGMSVREIAASLHVPKSTVSDRLQDALGQLRDLLKEEET